MKGVYVGGRVSVGIVGVVVAAVVLGGAVAGCGGGQQVSQAVKQVQPDRLEITRKNPLHREVVPMAQPFVVQDVGQVQKVYSSLLAMHTPFPKGTINCPADFALEYHLTFLKGSQKVLEADVNGISGCQDVKIVGQDEPLYGFTPEGAGFYKVLSETLGVTAQQLAGVPLQN